MKKYVKSSTYEQRVYNRIMENEVSTNAVVDFFIVKSTVVPEILNQVDEFLTSSGLVKDNGKLSYELLD